MERRSIALAACLGLLVMIGSRAAQAQYQWTNLVSNQVGQARHLDPLMVNAWGIARSATSPWWVSDQGSGWSTLYNGTGVQVAALKVLIPSAGENGPGQPTGLVINESSDFAVNGDPAVFLFATLDGTIQGWSPRANFNQSIVAVNNGSAGAVYTGLAITSHSSGNMIYAANLNANQVEVYDGSFALVKTFTDPSLPSGFGPFGIQDIGGMLYVAFAAINESPGGVIDVFQEDGTFVKTVAQGGPLNQPWGLTLAPSNFGKFSNALLVSNNTNAGTINAFDNTTGKFLGALHDKNGKLIVINQLWAIGFGGGSANNGATNQLYFTAGPAGNLAGTFGVITP